MVTAARQFLRDVHDWEAVHIKSQQYDCLKKNGVTMTGAALQTLMGTIHKACSEPKEGRQEMAIESRRISFLQGKAS